MASRHPKKSLVITHLDVVEDDDRTFNPCTGAGTPMGPWTFGHLMTQMANQPVTGIHPSTFVLNWLNKWMGNQTVNGWTVAEREKIQTLVIDPWVAASGGPHRPLNLSIAPFKLLAIVNRVDLRNNTTYGGGDAGEGRFVFGVIDRTSEGGIDPYPGTGSRIAARRSSRSFSSTALTGGLRDPELGQAVAQPAPLRARLASLQRRAASHHRPVHRRWSRAAQTEWQRAQPTPHE